MRIKIFLRYLAVLLGVLCSIGYAPGQSRNSVFNISVMGMDVGTLSVNQETVGDTITVEAISEVNVRIIFNIRVKYIQKCIYEKGVLIESSLHTYKKEEINSTTRLVKQGNGYTLDRDGDISYINDIINYSGSLLYFHEPENVEKIYFEIDGEKKNIVPSSLHEYTITTPHREKKGNTYTYKNGILCNAILKHAVAKVYLTLLEETT